MARYFRGDYGFKLDFEGPLDFEKFFQKTEIGTLNFLAGCGFESRTVVIMQWLTRVTNLEVSCKIVDLLNKQDPQYPEASKLQRKNMDTMVEIAGEEKWLVDRIATNLYTGDTLAHQPVLNSLRQTLTTKIRSDFLLDISSLPRYIVLPALRVLWESSSVRNLLVAYTEDPSVWALERQATRFRKPAFVPLFWSPRPARNFSVWFPILGWDETPIDMILRSFAFGDTYPVVGFPSTRPIETDQIVRLHRNILAGNTENIVFASMNDPFQLSMRLNGAIDEIRNVFGEEASIVISPHGSKPQSVGVFLTAMSRGVPLVYCPPFSYRPKQGQIGPSHLYWVKGTPYGKRREDPDQ